VERPQRRLSLAAIPPLPPYTAAPSAPVTAPPSRASSPPRLAPLTSVPQGPLAASSLRLSADLTAASPSLTPRDAPPPAFAALANEPGSLHSSLAPELTTSPPRLPCLPPFNPAAASHAALPLAPLPTIRARDPRASDPAAATRADLDGLSPHQSDSSLTAAARIARHVRSASEGAVALRFSAPFSRPKATWRDAARPGALVTALAGVVTGASRSADVRYSDRSPRLPPAALPFTASDAEAGALCALVDALRTKVRLRSCQRVLQGLMQEGTGEESVELPSQSRVTPLLRSTRRFPAR